MSDASRVPLSVPTLSESAWTYVKECLDTGWVSTAGPFVKRFEDDICRYTGAGFAVATASGTAALHLAYLASGMTSKSVVLVPSLSFIATVNPVTYVGARPWFVDCDPVTWNVSVATLEAALRDARRAGLVPTHAVVTHLYGVPAEVDAIATLCASEGLVLVEDAAESLGSFYRGKHSGLFGRVGALSFNGNKIITTGAGGMVVTDDPKLAVRARHLSTQARTDAVRYLHDEVGYNYRLSNLHAALGVSQLEDLPRLRARRREIEAVYRRELASLPWLVPQGCPAHADQNGWLFSAAVAPGAPLTRDHILSRLDAQGIEARPVFEPLHAMPMYASPGIACAHATDVAARGLSLPTSPTSDEHRVCRALRELARPAEGPRAIAP